MKITAASIAGLSTGYKASFNTGFRNAPSHWGKVATRVASTGSHNTYAWLGQFPRLREWIGDRVIRELSAETYKITNKTFESTISVGRNQIEDDEFGVFNPLFEEMGYAARTHPDELLFGLVVKGFAEKCYDGQYFFDTDHPVQQDGKAASVSNVQSGSGKAWFLLDTTRALKPFIVQERAAFEFTRLDKVENQNVFLRDSYLYGVRGRLNVGFGFWQQAFGSKADLSRDNFRAARKAMMALKSDEGRPLGIRPNVLLVGPSNSDLARDIVLAEKTDGGKTNTDYKLVEIIETPWLD